MATLYKYVRVSDTAIEMLKRRTLWAATPLSFNDPFDCQTIILGDYVSECASIKEKYLADFTALLEDLAANVSSSPFIGQAVASESLRKIRSARDSDAAYAAFEQALDLLHPSLRPLLPGDAIALLNRKLSEIGVISLSARCDSLLMWSHYADNHLGFCLGFDRDALCRTAACQPVQYSRRLASTTLNEINVQRVIDLSPGATSTKTALEFATIPIADPALLQIIYSKAEDWAYEQEWRILRLSGSEEVTYPVALKEVIFGMRCSSAQRSDIMAAISSASPTKTDIQIREAVPATNQFALTIHEWPRSRSAALL